MNIIDFRNQYQVDGKLIKPLSAFMVTDEEELGEYNGEEDAKKEDAN